MRRYSRFGPVPESAAGLPLCEEEVDVPGPADGEGNRLLMGQWHYKDEVGESSVCSPCLYTFEEVLFL